jgi:hypothetical protein
MPIPSISIENNIPKPSRRNERLSPKLGSQSRWVMTDCPLMAIEKRGVSNIRQIAMTEPVAVAVTFLPKRSVNNGNQTLANANDMVKGNKSDKYACSIITKINQK